MVDQVWHKPVYSTRYRRLSFKLSTVKSLNLFSFFIKEHDLIFFNKNFLFVIFFLWTNCELI